MRLKFVLVFSLAFISFNALCQTSKLDLYLLIGQSNMAGRGKIESQDTIAPPRVFSLNKKNQWVPAKDPIHFDKTIAGVGLGRSFGIAMSKANPNVTIGLIPCAVGGSSISCWQPGGYHKQTNTYPFDDMEKRLMLALKEGNLKGILWHQGEGDSNPEDCFEYGMRLEQLIQSVRKLARDDEIPFVAGELGKFKIKRNKQKYPKIKPSPSRVVVKATKKLTRSDKNAAFVESSDLTHKGDFTHFDAASYRELGRRYAKAMLELQN